MKNRKFVTATAILMALLIVIITCWTEALAASVDVPRISIEAAQKIMDNPDVIFIDLRLVCLEKSRISDRKKINPPEILALQSNYTRFMLFIAAVILVCI